MGLFFREIHCTQCKYEGKAKTIHKGSVVLQLFLFLCGIVPGVIYTIWRMTAGKYSGCPDCKGANVVDLEKWRARNRGAA